MTIKLINFGGEIPVRAHHNDAGADVFANITSENCDYYDELAIEIDPHTIRRIPLGFGLELPDGFVAFVVPRSGMTANKGITSELVPIDSGYRGEIHAILYNANDEPVYINDGDKVAQLVIMPTVLANFTFDNQKERGEKAFGSTGDTKWKYYL